MNSQMGQLPTGSYKPPNYNTGFKVYMKTTDLRTPPPAKAWIFVDEHPGSINDGYFQVSMASMSWPDVPASYHNGACGFSFADGHCEARKWQDSETRVPVAQGVTVQSVPTAHLADLRWVRERSSAPE
jgi:prepilin-type processing-associated H-X9-DG protein